MITLAKKSINKKSSGKVQGPRKSSFISSTRVTELDLLALYELKNKDVSLHKQAYIVQYLGQCDDLGNEIDPQDLQNATMLSKMKVSDGFCWTLISPFTPVFGRLMRGELNKNDIIRAEIVPHEGGRVLYMPEFEVVYRASSSDLNGRIGNPIYYQSFEEASFSNPGGSVVIPNTLIQANDLLGGGGMQEEGSGVGNGQKQLGDHSDGKMTPKFTNQLKISQISKKADFIEFSVFGKVVDRSKITTFPRGFHDHQLKDGMVLNIVIEDHTGKIQVTLYTKEVQRFEPMIQEGCVYKLSGFSVKPSSVYNQTGNRWELCSSRTSTITEIQNQELQRIQFLNKVKVNEIDSQSVDDCVDLVCLVKHRKQPVIVTLKNGLKTLKTELVVYDDSLRQVTAVFWGNCQHLGALKSHQIVVLRKMVIKEFRGARTANSSHVSRILVNSNQVDTEEYQALTNFRNGITKEQYEGLEDISDYSRNWPVRFEELSKTSIHDLVTDAESKLMRSNSPVGNTNSDLNDSAMQVEPSGEGNTSDGDGPDLGDQASRPLTEKLFYRADLRISWLPKNLVYQACPPQDCLKKMLPVDQSTGGGSNAAFFCPKCQSYKESSKLRYLFSARFVDPSGSLFALVSKPHIAELIFGCGPDTLYRRLQEFSSDADFEALGETIKSRSFEGIIMAKRHNYQGVTSIRYTIIKLEEITQNQ